MIKTIMTCSSSLLGNYPFFLTCLNWSFLMNPQPSSFFVRCPWCWLIQSLSVSLSMMLKQRSPVFFSVSLAIKHSHTLCISLVMPFADRLKVDKYKSKAKQSTLNVTFHCIVFHFQILEWDTLLLRLQTSFCIVSGAKSEYAPVTSRHFPVFNSCLCTCKWYDQ